MSQPKPHHALKVVGLTKVFKTDTSGNVTAVEGVSFRVPKGSVFGILGANGAGKTTTIKMICGLILPTAGGIEVCGHDILRSRRAAMPYLGAVLEGTRNVYWRLTPWENLLYFGRLKGLWGRRLKSRAEFLLRGLELWERKKQVVRQFSRGMQQKVAIACALIGDPEVVLLDEPTIGLDIHTSQTIKTWIQSMTRDRGKTVLLTTHQLALAEELCGWVAILNGGRMVANHPMAKLLSRPGEDFYRIRVGARMEPAQCDGFNLDILHNGKETQLSGRFDSNASLYAVLEHLRRLQVPLLSVVRHQPSLEDVFVALSPRAEKRKAV